MDPFGDIIINFSADVMDDLMKSSIISKQKCHIILHEENIKKISENISKIIDFPLRYINEILEDNYEIYESLLNKNLEKHELIEIFNPFYKFHTGEYLFQKTHELWEKTNWDNVLSHIDVAKICFDVKMDVFQIVPEQYWTKLSIQPEYMIYFTFKDFLNEKFNSNKIYNMNYIIRHKKYHPKNVFGILSVDDIENIVSNGVLLNDWIILVDPNKNNLYLKYIINSKQPIPDQWISKINIKLTINGYDLFYYYIINKIEIPNELKTSINVNKIYPDNNDLIGLYIKTNFKDVPEWMKEKYMHNSQRYICDIYMIYLGYVPNHRKYNIPKYRKCEEKKDSICTICQESLEKNILITQCDHYYHIECIMTWDKKHNTCPVCTQQL